MKRQTLRHLAPVILLASLAVAPPAFAVVLQGNVVLADGSVPPKPVAIQRICEGAGGSLDDIVKMTIYLVDIKNNTEVWRARREFFTGNFPASTLVEVRSLAGPETLVEIETVAWLGKK